MAKHPLSIRPGKTMLAQRIPGILPPLNRNESLETRIHSAMGLLPDGIALMDQRPVRMPHHSATAQALVGGGGRPARKFEMNIYRLAGNGMRTERSSPGG